MKTMLTTFCSWLALGAGLLLVVPVGANAADNTQNAITLGIHGGGGAGASAVAGTLEYERLMNDWLSIGVRVGGLSYDFEEDSYEESGDGTGIDAAVRFYFTSNGLEGPHVAIHLGVWQTDWEWTDPTDSPRAGSGSSTSTNLSAAFGWKFRIGDSFVLQPSLTVGDFLANSTDDTGTQEQELGFYAMVGVALGFAF